MAYQYENVKLEKGMYGQNGRSFLKVLESLDPSENYKGTALEGLDAFQRQLKRFDIHVKGAGSDMVEKFFHTSESSVLFPEFVSRVVRQGMESDILPDITATVTNFDGMDYRSIASVPTDDDKELKRVEERAGIPTTRIRTQENLVKLHKRGRMLVASYEAIRFQRLDLFSVTLRQIGAYIARMHLKDAIDVLMNGDGNNNAATSYTIGDGGIGARSRPRWVRSSCARAQCPRARSSALTRTMRSSASVAARCWSSTTSSSTASWSARPSRAFPALQSRIRRPRRCCPYSKK